MGSTVKTDNASLPSKIALRRWLLERMELTEVRVLDTCTGLGKIWDAMAEHVTIRQWTRCDVKPRRAGTLALEATEAIRRMPIDIYNVVDIDPYGEPWDPYLALLPRITAPLAVFLTHGKFGGRSTSTKAAIEAMGIPPTWPYPRTPALYEFAADWHLSNTWRHVNVAHAATVELSHVTYYALGLEPR